MPNPKPRALVIVHGVGATKRGAMLRQLVGELSGPLDERHKVGDATYPQVALDRDRDFAEAYEAYWADLKPGGDSLAARVLRVFDVLLALSKIGGRGWHANRRLGVNERSVFGELLHGLLWAFVLTLPCAYLPLLYLNAIEGSWGYLAAVAAVAPAIALAIYLGRLERLCWVAATLGTVAAGTMTWMARTQEITLAQGAALAAYLVSAVQLGAIALTSLACIELAIKTLRRGRRPTVAAALVRFASLSLPFTILGGVMGSLVWAVHFSAIAKLAGVSTLVQWGDAYQDKLRYDLALLELGFATTTLAFTLFVAGVFCLFLVRQRFGEDPAKNPNDTARVGIGERARDGLLASLWVLCLGGLAVGTLYLVNFWLLPKTAILEVWPLRAARDLFLEMARTVVNGEENENSAQLDVFAIYLASAARVAGFLPWLLGPVRNGAALAADVVLFLVPDDRTSYRTRARAHLINLLSNLEKDHEVYILAHSQGTAVALDALNHSAARPALLITAGSPIDTLYKRFLGIVGQRPSQPFPWRNFYRLSDYIGGEVEIADNGKDGRVLADYRDNHLNYFHDRGIIETLRAGGGD